MRTSYLAGLLLAAGVVLACGCTKLTYENWQRIEVGSESPEAVEARLGEPWRKVEQTWIYNDLDRGVTAMIKFADGKVVGKRWADVEHGLETVGEQPDEPGETEKIEIRTVE
ncbi:MAG TPA: hypothetical protein PL151_04255 [Phycisphaerae bacterium]|nr:hypothetical protein [Phycisphaerae bacterium]HOJ74413.1 hypothetical protein [Phycisphaerae bacterium]HOM52902.1 hypothetical protein [Phycisphaerae bacterium]HON67916.1 hypothetical protein [Phycisphaerae bacterium]HOQ85751.1 hypothetical protein [Phycisphaerae bacterium]